MKNIFKQWLDINQFSLTSKVLDEALGQKEIQKSIANSSDNQALLAYYDDSIINKYFSVIDYKSRFIRSQITESDVDRVKGFERSDNYPESISNYFKYNHTLTTFVQKDILDHNELDSKQSAFRRMVALSQRLFDQHNFDAFFIITSTLIRIPGSSELVAGLPQKHQQVFNWLTSYVNSMLEKNAVLLRTHINKISDENKLYPFILFTKDWTSYNATVAVGEQRQASDSQSIVEKTRVQLLQQLRVSNHRKYSDSHDKFFSAWEKEAATFNINDYYKLNKGACKTTPKIYSEGMIPFFKRLTPHSRKKYLENIHPINCNV